MRYLLKGLGNFAFKVNKTAKHAEASNTEELKG